MLNRVLFVKETNFHCIFFQGTMMQYKIITVTDSVEKEALQKASKLAIEAISNIRTVAGIK